MPISAAFDELVDVDPLTRAAGGELTGVNVVGRDYQDLEGGRVRIVARTSVQPHYSEPWRVVQVAVKLRCAGGGLYEALWDGSVRELRIGLYVSGLERIGRWPNRTLGSLVA